MVEIIFSKSDENKYLCLNGIIKVRCYGQIHQSVHRCGLQADFRLGNQQGPSDRFSERLVGGGKEREGYPFPR